MTRYTQIAYYLHELTCCERAYCTYGQQYTVCPPPDPSYHCQSAVVAENCAAAIVRKEKKKK